MMLPPLRAVETACLPVPTFSGVITLSQNCLTICDWLAVKHRLKFITCGVLLWIFPQVFTWPVKPFKFTFLFILRLLGFEKKGVRKASAAARFQGRYYGAYTPYDSPYAYLQSAAAEEEKTVPLYAQLLGWIAGVLAFRTYEYF